MATTVQSVIGDTIPALVQMMEPFDRIAAVLCATPLIEPHPRRPPIRPLLTADNLTGHIQLIDAHFTYPTENQKPVLKGMNAEILAGQKVALCGKTGCGKSTLINLLQNLYRIDKGQLLVDGEPIERYDVHSLRRNIGIVAQETVLFSKTIKDNIICACSLCDHAVLLVQST
eukprot:COSAG06_NODE_688_length_13072_cov_15.012719_9_plen_172_part_00